MQPSCNHGQRHYCRLFPPATRPVPGSDAWKKFLAATLKLVDCMKDDFKPLCKGKPDVRIPSGFTYFGQLVDHDTTHDRSQLDDLWNTPFSELINGQIPFLDLGVLYGMGPDSAASGMLYDGIRLKVGGPAAWFDLPMGTYNRPLAADRRSTENIIQRQMVAAFARLHNAAVDQFEKEVDDPDQVFERARLQLTWQYQWLVCRDFLPRLLDPKVYSEVFVAGRTKISWQTFSMPIEYAAAAFRFGHSMVREQYQLSSHKEASLNDIFARSAAPGPLEAEWQIDWARFFQGAGRVPAVTAMPIDTRIAETMHNMPGPIANLPHTSITRDALLRLPSGQTAARLLGYRPLNEKQLTCDCSGKLTAQGEVLCANGLTKNTPLFYYLLKEAEVYANGNRLGPTGSRIVAETLYASLLFDPQSIFNHPEALAEPPTWIFTGSPKQFRSLATLFRAIGRPF
jgi:Animal haem peroxidase